MFSYLWVFATLHDEFREITSYLNKQLYSSIYQKRTLAKRTNFYRHDELSPWLLHPRLDGNSCRSKRNWLLPTLKGWFLSKLRFNIHHWNWISSEWDLADRKNCETSRMCGSLGMILWQWWGKYAFQITSVLAKCLLHHSFWQAKT